MKQVKTIEEFLNENKVEKLNEDASAKIEIYDPIGNGNVLYITNHNGHIMSLEKDRPGGATFRYPDADQDFYIADKELQIIIKYLSTKVK